MNGLTRVLHTAQRDGTWHVGGKDFAGKMLNVQELISDKYDLLIEVTYSGYTIKAAKLWDFSNAIITNSPDGVATQQLTAADRNKAARIEDVLLGNFRRF